MSSKKIFLILMTFLLSGFFVISQAQVKITDGVNPTMNANSLLELESTNKGLLIPRMAINDLNQADPLTAPVPTGMLVYSTGGSVPDGFYYWNGSMWTDLGVSGNLETPMTKTATTTLLTTETFVLASGDITLTLPVVTSTDNGLAITIKNIGSFLNLVTVSGNSGSTIDGYSSTSLTRWCGQTYIAWEGNWYTKNNDSRTDNRIVVSQHGSLSTIAEAIEFLSAHMTAPTVVVLSSELYTAPDTYVIDLPYPVTFEGQAYGSVTIGPASGMSGQPLFNCISECSFKMINFDAATLSGYGSGAGEDAIQLTGSGTYHEIKDCSFDGFYNAVANLSDAELWLFECDISNSHSNGLLLNSSSPGAVVKVSETDFTHNIVGVNFLAGSGTTVTLNSGFYSNQNDTDIGILYNPSTFSFDNLIITGNSWNFIGTGISGFDFSRADGRDANAFVENNAGVEDEKPHCMINVVGNSLTTTCIVANSWYKANWINTASVTTNFTINNNRIIYQPVKPRDVSLIISGDLTVPNSNEVVTIAIVKNDNTSSPYGETKLRITTANQPFQFSTVIYLEDVAKGDYFELYCSTLNNNDEVTFQDINWYVTAQ
jgi:hypothetical protein